MGRNCPVRCLRNHDQLLGSTDHPPTGAKPQASVTLGDPGHPQLRVSRQSWRPAPMTGSSPGAIVKARGGQPDWRVTETVLAGGGHELIDLDELLVRDRRVTQLKRGVRRRRQMSGHWQQPDPDLCWNCGRRGAVLGVVGRLRTCPECEVTWVPGCQPLAVTQIMSAGWAKQSCALISQSQNHLERQPERRKQSAYTGR